MQRHPHMQEDPAAALRAHEQQELEKSLARVRQQRRSYQRKIIAVAVLTFLIVIIVCALIPSDDEAGYEEKWDKPINSRQEKILKGLEENFK